MQVAYQKLDQLSSQLALAQATLISHQSAAAGARHTADALCSKFGGSSAECGDAKSKVDQLQPQILQTEQEIKLLQGDGSWDSLAARKQLAAAQAAYTAAADSLSQAEAARRVPAEVISAQAAYDAAVSTLTSATARLDQTKITTQTNLAAAQAEVDVARAEVESATAKFDTASQGTPAADLVAAQTAVDTAQANLDSAQAKFDVSTSSFSMTVACEYQILARRVRHAAGGGVALVRAGTRRIYPQCPIRSRLRFWCVRR